MPWPNLCEFETYKHLQIESNKAGSNYLANNFQVGLLCSRTYQHQSYFRWKKPTLFYGLQSQRLVLLVDPKRTVHGQWCPVKILRQPPNPREKHFQPLGHHGRSQERLIAFGESWKNPTPVTCLNWMAVAVQFLSFRRKFRSGFLCLRLGSWHLRLNSLFCVDGIVVNPSESKKTHN